MKLLVTDALWERLAPLLPPTTPSIPHRPAVHGGWAPECQSS